MLDDDESAPVAKVEPAIPFHTRVSKAGKPEELGTVMPHNPEFTNGRFPVCWDRWGGMWEPGVTVGEVDILGPRATVTRIVPRAPAKRKATLPKRRAV